MMINVLHIVTRIDIGGISSFLYDHYRFMDRQLIQIDVVAIDTGIKQEYHNRLEGIGMNVYYMPNSLIDRSTYLFSFIRKHKYDIVHSHIEMQSAFYLALAAICGVKGRFAHSHLSVNRRTFRDKGLRWLLNKVATKRFGVSEYSICTVFGEKYKNTSSVLNNALEVEKYNFNKYERAAVRKTLGLDNKYVVGFVGRLTYLKNIFYLLDVFVEFKKTQPSALLMIVGAGELTAQIMDKIQKLKISNSVLMLGSRSDINDLMKAMDVLLLPSFSEGLGRVLIEAQASALKCIASKEGVSSEAKISDYLLFQEINKPPSSWANLILNQCMDYKREPITKIIEKNNYSIELQAKRLTEYYKKEVETNAY